MSLFDFKKVAILSAIGLTILFGAASTTNAQTRMRRQIELERQTQIQEQVRIDRQRRRNRSPRVTVPQVVDMNYSAGYEQGFLAGQYDRRKRKYNQSNVYRGTGSAPNSGDPTSSDYLYRQGYLQGYNDGYYVRKL